VNASNKWHCKKNEKLAVDLATVCSNVGQSSGGVKNES
jgi:hypothetical protein